MRIILTFALLAAAALWEVHCPLHPASTCYDTGEVSPTGSNAHKWHCSCGDDVWVNQ